MCSNKKTNARKKNYTLAVLFLAVALIPNFAFSAGLYDQNERTDIATSSPIGGVQIITQQLLNLTQTISSVTVPILYPTADDDGGKFISSINFLFASSSATGKYPDSCLTPNSYQINLVTTGITIFAADEIQQITFDNLDIPTFGDFAWITFGVGGGSPLDFFHTDTNAELDLQSWTWGSNVCSFPTFPATSIDLEIDTDWAFKIEGVATTTTVINIVEPTQGTTTATTTVNVIVDLFNNGQADVITLFVENRVTSQQVPIFPFDFSIAAGFVTTDIDIELPTGSYTLRAALFNSISGTQFGNAKRVDFNVINNEFLEVFGVDITDVDDLLNLATTTCSFTNLSGCFQNALVFAFVPAEDSFDRFVTLKDQLINKPPFGYFALLADGLSGLNATSSSAFVLATEDNITNIIFNPIKTGLSWLLFVFFGVYLYKRVIAIQL